MVVEEEKLLIQLTFPITIFMSEFFSKIPLSGISVLKKEKNVFCFFHLNAPLT